MRRRKRPRVCRRFQVIASLGPGRERVFAKPDNLDGAQRLQALALAKGYPAARIVPPPRAAEEE